MPQGQQWPRTIREAAERLGAEDGLSAPRIAERLAADHGAEVPEKTIRGWLRSPLSRRPSGDLSADLRSLANRAAALCEAEMTVLERHGRRPIDVDRLAKLVSLLRRLDELQAAKQKPKQNGLAKLGGQGLEALLNEVQAD